MPTLPTEVIRNLSLLEIKPPVRIEKLLVPPDEIAESVKTTTPWVPENVAWFAKPIPLLLAPDTKNAAVAPESFVRFKDVAAALPVLLF